MTDEIMDDPARSANPDGGHTPPAAPRTAKRGPIGLWTAVGIAVIALSVVGAYLWMGRTQVTSVAEFRRAMEKQGWESTDGEPGNFVAKSSYDLWESGFNGFVTLIEYNDANAARSAHDKRSREGSAAPAYKETASGSVKSWSSLYPADSQQGQPPGTGNLEVQFGKYRFESTGDRSKTDALVSKLGYLDPNRKRTDPIAEFRAAVKESRITTSTDTGFSERSAFKNGDLVAECKAFYTPEDAQADCDTTAKWLESEKRQFKMSKDGAVRHLWFIVESPNSEGKQIIQYAARAYNGGTMTAVSGQVEDRSKMEDLMKGLGY